MNNHMLKILSILNALETPSIKTIHEKTGFSYRKIQNNKAEFLKMNIIDKKWKITPNGEKELSKYRVHNAVIYAAGFGSRLRPITNTTPKPLIKIYNKPLLEQAISHLIDFNYKKIFIVVGYLKENFRYLENKYPQVKLIENNFFKKINNISSLSVVVPYLTGTTLFLEGDVWWKNNVFPKYVNNSIIFAEKGKKNNEWTLIKKGRKAYGYEMNGIGPLWGNGYALDINSINTLKTIFSNIDLMSWKNSYAEEILWENNFSMEIQYINSKDRVEIDTLEDLSNIIGKTMPKSFINPMSCIQFVHSCQIRDIKDFEVLKGGLTNDTFKYRINKEVFVIRFPKKETNKNIDRFNEAEVLANIKDLNINVDVYYSNPNVGVLITKYLKNANVFYNEKNSIELVAKQLKILHQSKIKAKATLNPLLLIDKYLENIKEINNFILEKKERTQQLIKKYFKSDKEFFLCHNDLIGSNILKNNKDLFIIDWELSANNDPYWDIASLFMENNFSKEEETIFLKIYGFIDLKKVNDFKKIITFIWVIWCYQFNNFNENLTNYFNKTLTKLKKLYGK